MQDGQTKRKHNRGDMHFSLRPESSPFLHRRLIINSISIPCLLLPGPKQRRLLALPARQRNPIENPPRPDLARRRRKLLSFRAVRRRRRNSSLLQDPLQRKSLFTPHLLHRKSQLEHCQMTALFIGLAEIVPVLKVSSFHRQAPAYSANTTWTFTNFPLPMRHGIHIASM